MTIKPITDKKELQKYQEDESSAFLGTATELILPRNEQELTELLKSATATGTLVTVSGGGTGITGSRCPIHGGQVVSTENIRTPQTECPDEYDVVSEQGYTVYLNRDAKQAIAPGSIPLSILDGLLAPEQLFYPPDPTEMSATLGGTVATNASGARSYYYGPTRKWITSLKVVLPTGDILPLNAGASPSKNQQLTVPVGDQTVALTIPDSQTYPMPTIKNAAGLYLKDGMDLMDLFISSEGLLGCITDVGIKLTDRIQHTLSTVAWFDDLKQALAFVDSGVSHNSPLEFLSLELFDSHSLKFMKQKYPDIPDAGAGVLFELEYDQNDDNTIYPSSVFLDQIKRELRTYESTSNWVIPYSNREDIRLFRHTLPEVVNEYMRSRSGKLGTDMAVPHDRLSEMMDAYISVSQTENVPYVMFGHIGDDHVHLNFLPDDEAVSKRAKKAYTKLAATAVKLGGTVSAEHGVGKKQILDESGNMIPYLEIMFGQTGLKVIAEIKHQLDPALILNVGNMVPKELLEQVKSEKEDG